VNTFGTGRVGDEVLEKYILESFDMRPKAIIEQLDLLKPIYRRTAAYGHFGRDEFSWEKTDRAAKMADDLLRPSVSSASATVNGSGSHDKKKKKKQASSATELA
jgi:S-adenosylmethionine synthetase